MSEQAPVSAPQTTAPAQGNTASNAAAQQGGGQKTGGETSKMSTPQSTEPKTLKEVAEEFFEIKVKGKPVKMTRQQVLDRASMGEAAHQNFNEAKQMKAFADEILNGVKGDPIRTLIQKGAITKADAIKAIEDFYHSEVIEAEKLSPAERENRELKRQLKEWEEQKNKAEKERFDKEQSELTQKQIEYLSKEITNAIDTHGLPKSPWVAQQIAKYMKDNRNNGWNAPMSMIADQVKQDLKELNSGISDSTPPEQLLKLFEDMYGPEVIKKLRRLDLERLRKDKFSPPTPEQKNQRSAGNRDKKKSPEEVLRDIRLGKDTF